MLWIFFVAVIFHTTITVQTCEIETRIACPRPNMTCAKSFCLCSYNFTNVTCNQVLDDIPADMPSQVEYITIRENTITTIKAGTFVGLHSLKQVDLTRNAIQHIEPGAFVDLPRLSVINLNGNQIGKLRRDTFKDLPVQSLHLGRSQSGIESRAFNNLPNLISLTWQGVGTIQTEAFFNLSSLTLLFLYESSIHEIEERAFSYLPKLTGITLNANPLVVIKEKTFYNLPSLTGISFANTAISSIKRNSFLNLPAIENLYFFKNSISLIEQDAFINVGSGALYLSLAEDFVFEENVHINFTSIVFTDYFYRKNVMNCNCSFMWFALWLQDHPFTKVDGFCRNMNKSIDKLVTEDFSFCYDREEVNAYNLSRSIKMTCTSKYMKSNFKHWVHTHNGNEIRKLTGESIYNVTNVLTIPFLSYEDVGTYTCVRTTNYSALAEVASVTIKLSVYGPPIILNQLSSDEGNNLILSVIFYCDPYNEPDWHLGDIVLSTGSEYIITTTPYLVALNKSSPRMYQGFITNLTIINYKKFPGTTFTCKINNGFQEVKQRITTPVDIEIPKTTICNTSQTAELKCNIDYMEAIPDAWIHSSGKQMIRTLSGTVVNNTNILLIPFCNNQDMGDYTCIWRTKVSGLSFNKTTTLVVNGPPISLERLISRDGTDTVLSVFFFSQPFPMEPQWFFRSTPVVLGFDYQQTTSFSNVTVRQHKHDIITEGFVSNLTIVKPKPELYGDYSCKIVNDFGHIQKNFEVLVPNSLEPSSQNDRSTIITVSISLSAVIGFATILIIVVCKRRTQKKDEYMDAPVHYSSTEATYDSIGFSGEQETKDVYMEVH